MCRDQGIAALVFDFEIRIGLQSTLQVYIVCSLQVLVLVKFVNEFIISNPFIVCSDELSFVKKQLQREGDEVKVKQKAGVIQYKACQER